MSDLNNAFDGEADAGHGCPDVEAKEPVHSIEQLPLSWELPSNWGPSETTVEVESSILQQRMDGASVMEGRPSDIDAVRALQRHPVDWVLLEKALGLDASPESITIELSEDRDMPGLTATVKLITSPRQQESGDSPPVPSERLYSFAPTIMPLGKAALVQPPRRVTDARIGAEGREAFDSYGGTD